MKIKGSGNSRFVLDGIVMTEYDRLTGIELKI